MNYVDKIFEILRVKPRERFKLKSNYIGIRENMYYIDQSLEVVRCEPNGNYTSELNITTILLGKEEIIREPFVPAENDYYYFVTTNGNISGAIYNPRALLDLTFYRIGNCYQYKEDITETELGYWNKFFNADKKPIIEV